MISRDVMIVFLVSTFIPFQAGIYIGEMCRYLLASKESEADYSHQVVKMIGVGMRGDIWAKFVKRFHVQTIIEFYGATEGNANLGKILLLS
jgi:Acyl-CoA synthetases (AMP-forming)/AMP-acid ligases II